MKFIYENICGESGLVKVSEHFDDVFKVKDWDATIPNEGAFLGSIEGCNWMRENRPDVTFWSTFENYTCATYYPQVQELLFNDKYVFIPFKELGRRKWDLYGWLGKQSLVFIRPDSGEKEFPAELVDIQDIDKLVDNYDCDGMAVVSTPKNSVGEWRFVVHEGKVASVSCYKYQGLLTQVPSAPPLAHDLVDKVIAKGIKPDEIFCVDVVQDMGGDFWVMELTSFSSAGLYANDPKKVADVIKAQMKND